MRLRSKNYQEHENNSQLFITYLIEYSITSLTDFDEICPFCRCFKSEGSPKTCEAIAKTTVAVEFKSEWQQIFNGLNKNAEEKKLT